MKFDLHTHSTYSDGDFLRDMVSKAEELEIEEIGFTDHCNVSQREPMIEMKEKLGFNLDITYERRRNAIKRLNERYSVQIYDGVEIDYDPRDEEEIRDFLDKAGFDYAMGSVHHLDNVNIHVASFFENASREEREEYVDTYFEKLVALVESELFDVAAHIDLVERNPYLRDIAYEKHYEKVAEAFLNSRTIPEINAGRTLQKLGKIHPTPMFMKTLRRKNVEFTVGTDSHSPGELEKRADYLQKKMEEFELKPIKPPTLQKPNR